MSYDQSSTAGTEPMPSDVEQPEPLRAHIAQLEQALQAIRSGGIDSVIVGPPGAEQIHPIMGADRSYRAIVDEMGEGAAAVSERGIVLYVNRHLAQLLGQDRLQLVGSPAIELFREEDRGVTEGMLAMGPGVTGRVEVRLLHAGGIHVPVLLAVTCLDLGGALLHCLITTDVTSSKEAESTLAAANAALAEHGRNLERVNRELAASNAALAELADVVSHDLAEPLHTISECTRLITTRPADEAAPETTDSFELISSSVARMHQLIDGLVAYSSVDADAQPAAPVAIGDVVGAVLGDLHATINETSAEIRVDPLPTVVADRTQLAQVFAHLLRNALTYVPDGRAPSVHLGADRLDRAWRFTVADNGIGVASWHREQIFRLFQRDPTQSAGSGIGLAICKKIVERHGGRIWVEDNPAGGSKFRFTLPDPGLSSTDDPVGPST